MIDERAMKNKNRTTARITTLNTTTIITSTMHKKTKNTNKIASR